MSKLPYYLASGLLFSTSALALEAETLCRPNPSCESLGYSKTIPTNCTNILKCPFDTNYQKCLDCTAQETPGTCPAGSSSLPFDQCLTNGGIPVGYSTESGKMCCQTCPTDYRMVPQSKVSGMTCNSTVYTHVSGATYQCCTGCPDGKMTKEQCSAQNGVIKDGSLNSDTGCGECLTCECPGGKMISSGNEVKNNAPGIYCPITAITISGDLFGGTYTFRRPQGKTCSSGILTIDAVRASEIVSDLDVYVNANNQISHLTANNGGTFKSSLCGGTLSLGNHGVYDFQDSREGSCADTKIECNGSGQVDDESYISLKEGFSGSHVTGYYFNIPTGIGDGGNTCKGFQCRLSGKRGTITGPNTCSKN